MNDNYRQHYYLQIMLLHSTQCSLCLAPCLAPGADAIPFKTIITARCRKLKTTYKRTNFRSCSASRILSITGSQIRLWVYTTNKQLVEKLPCKLMYRKNDVQKCMQEHNDQWVLTVTLNEYCNCTDRPTKISGGQI